MAALAASSMVPLVLDAEAAAHHGASLRSHGYGAVPKGTVLRSVWSHKDRLLFGVWGELLGGGGTLKVWRVPDTTAHCLGWFWKGTLPFKATGMKSPHPPADQSMA